MSMLRNGLNIASTTLWNHIDAARAAFLHQHNQDACTRMTSLPGTLRDDVRLLGELLGNTILEHQGTKLFQQIEKIRQLSKALALARQYTDSGAIDYQPLVKALGALDDREVLSIARAFNQFLNLANIAD